MSADKEKLLAELDRCVLEMDDEAVTGVAQEYVDNGYDAYEGIVNGLSRGMEKAGELYEQEEYFVPELLICSDAMYNGLDVLRRTFPKTPRTAASPSLSGSCRAIPTTSAKTWSRSCSKRRASRFTTWAAMLSPALSLKKPKRLAHALSACLR